MNEWLGHSAFLWGLWSAFLDIYTMTFNSNVFLITWGSDL